MNKAQVKLQRRQEKELHRQKKRLGQFEQDTVMPPIHCACVIHGAHYDWQYVETLYNMIKRHLSHEFVMHVYTERSRRVPDHMIKHELDEWPGVYGPKRSWWYKLQLFDVNKYAGRLLYFDLDTVICNSINWVLDCDPKYFWAVKDFKHLWRTDWQGLNSSILYFDNRYYTHIWQYFHRLPLDSVIKQYPGDQDFLSSQIPLNQLRFFDTNLVKSWRWEILDGGLDMKSRKYRRPGAGAVVPKDTSLMIFHGTPKPKEVQDPFVVHNWL